MQISAKHVKHQGGKSALKATIVAEIAVFLVLTTFLVSASQSFIFVINLFSYVEPQNLLLFICTTLIFSYFLGRKAAVAIIIKRRNHLVVAFIAGILAAVFSTITTSFLILAISIIDNNFINDWFFYFVIKPLIWIIPLSIIPVSIAATWFAIKLNKYR